MISTSEYNKAVKNLSPNLFRYLFKCLKDEEASFDIIQDCFEKLWNNRKTVDSAKVKPWLFTTAHNLMVNYTKRQSKGTRLNPELHDIKEAKSDSFEIKEMIDKALSLLPEIQRAIVLLRDLEGYNYKEIGEILNLKEPQVKVYLFRARKKIKETIKDLHFVL
ncbi:RNA polymerase sigma factor [Cytophagaceae bacterium ABcell3]|nr:RNA polymerase sigma factor [Cytophagaceae bacterium ABcell3]